MKEFNESKKVMFKAIGFVMMVSIIALMVALALSTIKKAI